MLDDQILVGALIAALALLALAYGGLRARHAKLKATLSRVRRERDDLRTSMWAQVTGEA